MGKNIKKKVVDGLISGLMDAAQHSRGRLRLNSNKRELPKAAPKWSPAKIRYLRVDICNLSQPIFAALLNVTTATVRSWEQGRKSPSGAALRLLQIVENDNQAIEKLVA
jgi:putative transcriptional regulator